MKETSLTETERTEYLSYIYESSEKLLKLINYLLDWSKLQTGKLQLHSERINVQGLVYNCISSLTGTAVRKDIDIKVDIDNSLNVRGDERLLNIVMTNLLSNAIKFTVNGSIKIGFIVVFIIISLHLLLNSPSKTRRYRLRI